MSGQLSTLKEELHKLIEVIEDEQSLNILKEEATAYLRKEEKAVDDNFNEEAFSTLSPEELQDLEESIEEVERGEVISYEEFKENVKKWLTK